LTSTIEKAKQIRCLVLDLDGVLTDAGIYIHEDKTESRRFNIQDGFGIKILQSLGFEVAIITGSRSDIVEHRMTQLGIKHFYTSHIHKLSAFEDLKSKLNMLDHEFAYMGDDYQDMVLLQKVGLSFAPANAIEPVKSIVDICTKASGGQGAVREACEFFFQVHNKTQDIIEYFNHYPCHTLEKVY
jgi:3-deoxy-D-manno-octulosonate 8-phosphate phosphatase (KDO 8-P phosphatase)